MWKSLKDKILRFGITARSMIMKVVTIIIFAYLAPSALDAIASYTPSDATLLIIWGLLPVVFVLSFVLDLLGKL